MSYLKSNKALIGVLIFLLVIVTFSIAQQNPLGDGPIKVHPSCQSKDNKVRFDWILKPYILSNHTNYALMLSSGLCRLDKPIRGKVNGTILSIAKQDAKAEVILIFQGQNRTLNIWNLGNLENTISGNFSL